MNFVGTHTFSLRQDQCFLSLAMGLGDLHSYGQKVKSDIDNNLSQRCLKRSEATHALSNVSSVCYHGLIMHRWTQKILDSRSTFAPSPVVSGGK